MQFGSNGYFAQDVKLTKLCWAIAGHETAYCKKGVGKTHNNCVGIKRKGKFVVYSTPDKSIADCASVWSKYYKNVPPTLADARRWSGNDRANIWLRNVTNNYNK